MKASFIKRRQLTETIASFTFQPATSFSATAGQFIELRLPGHQEHGQRAHRWFTLSSAPHETNLTITTRVGSAAHSAYKRALQNLQPGDSVEISEPLGDFVLPRLLQTPLVFVAGGIGITPFHSMLSWLTHAKEQRPIQMFHAVKVEDDIIFQDTFAAARQHLTIVVEQPSAAWGGERGVLDAALICGLQAPAADALYYLSGPEPFVQRLQNELLASGVSNQRIVLDEFQGYAEV